MYFRANSPVERVPLLTPCANPGIVVNDQKVTAVPDKDSDMCRIRLLPGAKIYF